MKMPGKFGGSDYRYAYQGQEKDGETGFESFELRQWDGRIGRWMTTDPYGQYASPYLGMGNDPINGIDPDGGKRVYYNADGTYNDTSHNNWFHNTFFGIDNYIENTWGGFSQVSDSYFHDSFTMNPHVYSGEISSYNYDWANEWSDSNNLLASYSYDMVDGLYVTTQSFIPIVSDRTHHLNGHSALGGRDRTEAFVNASGTLVGRMTALITPAKALTFNQFAKLTKGQYKGVNHMKVRWQAFRTHIKNHSFSQDFEFFGNWFGGMTKSTQNLTND